MVKMTMISMKTDVHLHSLEGTLAGEGGTHSVAANPMGPDILIMVFGVSGGNNDSSTVRHFSCGL